MALGFLRPNPRKAVPELECALRSKNSDVASAAANALGRLGAMGAASLVEGLRSDDPLLRRVAAHGLTLIADENDDVVIALCAALRDPDESVRQSAIQSLGFMRARAVQALPALLAAKSREGDSWQGYFISCALSWVVPSAVPHLIEALKDGDAEVRRNAARHFADAVSFSKKNIELLAKAGRHDPVEGVRAQALMVMEQIGIDAAEALATVMDALEKAEHSPNHAEVRTRSLLSQEKIRTEVARLLRVPRSTLQLTPVVSSKTRKPKRLPDDFGKSVLALLRTCRYWAHDSVSERKLHASENLKDQRSRLGLDEQVSQTSVHNHMMFLAKLCGLDSLVEVDKKRQVSRFRKGAKERLATIENSLGQYVRDEADLAARKIQTPPFDRAT